MAVKLPTPAPEFNVEVARAFASEAVRVMDARFGRKTKIRLTDAMQCNVRNMPGKPNQILDIMFGNKIMRAFWERGYQEYKSLEYMIPRYYGVRPVGLKAIYALVMHEYAHIHQLTRDNVRGNHGPLYKSAFDELWRMFDYKTVCQDVARRNRTVALYLRSHGWKLEAGSTMPAMPVAPTSPRLQATLQKIPNGGTPVRFMLDNGKMMEGVMLARKGNTAKVAPADLSKLYTVEMALVEML